MYQLGKRSLDRLQGVHSDLVRVVVRALQLSDIDITVVEGRRTPERQRVLVAEGKSKTLNSRHLTGHAVDVAPLVNGVIPWSDWTAFERVAVAMKRAAAELGVAIEWGGDWKTFRDGPHFQIPVTA